MIELSCILSGKRIRLSTDVIDSNIPLLWSKDSIRLLKVKLDLENDVAETLRISQSLDCSVLIII